MDELIVEDTDNMYKIILNRPEKGNSLSPGMLEDLSRILGELKSKKERRAVIITGAGKKFFSAGADIEAVLSGDVEGSVVDKHLKSIEDYPYPVIAMINGYALGAGCELAATCDIRVACEEAKFGMPPAKLGVVYSYSGIRKFLNLIGVGRTKLLFLTGKIFTAQEAYNFGLLDFLVANNELEKFTMSLAKEIMECAPLALSGMKKIINLWVRNQVYSKADEKKIRELITKAFSSEDLKEGLTAFREKRKPKFVGK